MAHHAGDRLGPYEILAPIGKGGMGEVYRARDTRLGREVAIKVSAEQFSERFEREARAVAALNHPNICTLHDVGPNYLVMEYIEGEPPKGPLPLEEALEIARQIGDALEAAHEKGIVHRDLKPGNIKIKSDGTVKVLDFGLAKFGGTPTVTTEDSPTLSMAATQAGMILGTAGYMSPEQARGKEVDKRADIWAFGVVLYEMLTGDRLFEGETVSDTLAAVLRKEPDLGRVPLKARRLVRRCLEKDPKDRLRDVADAWPLLEQGPEAESSSRSKLPWAVAGVLLIASLVVSFVHLRETPPTPIALRLPVALPEFSNLSSLALSADGRTIVLAASPTTGQTQLYLRSLDSAEPRLLSGTQAARTPFWSADGRSIGFFADGKLKIVSASGGPVRTLCDAGLGYGGTWNHDGVILFGSTTTRQILRVSASGSSCAPVLTPQGNIAYSFPVFLPDGRNFFYGSDGGDDESKAGVYIASLDNPSGRRVLADQSSVIYAPLSPAGKLAHLLFLREATLMAQPFNPRTLQTIGDVFAVASQASISNTPPQVAAAVGANDVLVYISNRDPDHQLAWFDRFGKKLSTVGPRGRQPLALSPDGRSVVVVREEAATRRFVLWRRDLTRDVETRLTDPSQRAFSPALSPDGSHIAFGMNRDLYLKDASGGMEEPLLQNANSKVPSGWSPDGQALLYTEIDPKDRGDIWVLSDPMNKSGGRKPVPFLRTRFNESQAQFSPDGHWIAYTSDESGKYEVYVRPFPTPASAPNTQWQISSGQASQPRWSRDGKELFYLQGIPPRFRLMAMPIKTGLRPIVEGAAPEPLFELRAATLVPESNMFAYSPSPDGQRFLVNAYADENAQPTLNVLVNWQALAKKGAPAR